MIIDFHTHVFPEKIAERAIEKLSRVSGLSPATDGTVNGLIRSMNKNKIDYSVLMPIATSAMQTDGINAGAVANMEKYGDAGIISFGSVHPDNDNYKDIIRSIKNNGIKGIKIHPAYQDCDIDDIRFMRIVDFASEQGLIVLTHGGYDIGIRDAMNANPDKIGHVIDEVGPEKFIIAHMGGWECYDDVVKYLVGKNVYFDLSFCLTPKEAVYTGLENIKHLIMLHGIDKIIFGTDSPWSDQGEYIKEFSKLSFDESDADRILYKNAKDLLGL